MISKIVFFTICVFALSLNGNAQNNSVTLSGIVKEKSTNTPMPYVTVVLKTEKDSALVLGTITNEEGRFTINTIKKETIILKPLL